ncbi:hypothetical protein HZP34_17760 [Elizabethkingia anophelis]|nr:hypothetical protein [Elizabethkingia anophelis]
MVLNVSNRLYWVRIIVIDGKYPTDKIKYNLYWEVPWAVRSKWNWYFKYRAALAQVQNPKCLVDFKWGNKEPDKKTLSEFTKDAITGKKRMITKLQNEIDKHKSWLIDNNIFGLAGDDGRLFKAEMKLNKYQCELFALQKDLKSLESK